MAFTAKIADIIADDKTGLLSKHDSWERVTLSDIVKILNGAPFDSAHFNPTTGTALARIRDVLAGESTTYYSGAYEEVYMLKQGDLLVGMDGDFHTGFWGTQPALLNQRVCKLTPDESFYDKALLGYVLPGYLAAINAHTPSITVKHLSSKTIGEIELPLPPRAEQTRIVEKLESLLADLDAGVAELKAAQRKLAQYRQSLLKSAVEGALTADWRAERFAPLSPCGRGVGGEGANEAAKGTNPPDSNGVMLSRARELRREQTPHEQKLWQQLRAKRFDGFKFRRQQQIGHYITDFACMSARLIVELDGGGHAERKKYDAERDAWLRSQGFRVLRIWNNEWDSQPDAVLERIWHVLHEAPPLPNPSPARGEGLESGEQLLHRILQERHARFVQKHGSKKKYKDPVAPDVSQLPELPDGWVWATIEQLALEQRYGSSAKTSADTQGVPVIRMGNIQNGELDLTELKYLPKDHDEFPSLYLQDGDLLFNRTNSPELVGKTTVYRSQLAPCSYASYLIAVRFTELFIPELASAYINSALGRNWIKSVVTQQVGQANVNGTKLAALAVPLPPLAEQHAILAHLETALAACKQQEQAIAHGLKLAAAQRRNLLRAAFAGQLVPQDPNDEPASELLARIRAGRTGSTGKTGSRTRRRGRLTSTNP